MAICYTVQGDKLLTINILNMNTITKQAMSPEYILSSYIAEASEMTRQIQQMIQAKKSLEMLNTIYKPYESIAEVGGQFGYVGKRMDSFKEQCEKDYEYAREESHRHAIRVLWMTKEMRKCGLPVDENMVKAAQNEIKDFRRAK